MRYVSGGITDTNVKLEHTLYGDDSVVAKADLKIAAKEKDTVELPLKHPETTSLAVAQVDRYACADGTTWARQ